MAAVNALRDLSGSGLTSDTGVVAAEVGRIDRIAAFNRLIVENRLDWAIDAGSLTGFSPRFGDSGIAGNLGGATFGQLIIETLVRDRMVILQVTNTYSLAGRESVTQLVTELDGRPLPRVAQRR